MPDWLELIMDSLIILIPATVLVLLVTLAP
jgi:hypothetical protein